MMPPAGAPCELLRRPLPRTPMNNECKTAEDHSSGRANDAMRLVSTAGGYKRIIRDNGAGNHTGGLKGMMIKPFAQILGVVLILVGIVGLILGDKVWLGILNVDIVEDLVHLATGGLLAYVGFSGMDLSAARSVVLALGVIYLLVGILGFVVPEMFGLIPDGYTIFDDLLHLALGVLGLVVALSTPSGSAQRGRSASA
jgi:hypothetical protein